MREYANDPNETQIQYDLYRIPFNGGKGGKAERIAGASENGMSNNFPKVSPDGKWIVFVRNKNGLLMRPDSQLYIVPFEGGAERPMRSNQTVMNSWHSFSPNGRWLVFSSKSPSLYTQMYLTHIDEKGNDSPGDPDRERHGRQSRGEYSRVHQYGHGRPGSDRCARHRLLSTL